jgi:hypothetical protein
MMARRLALLLVICAALPARADDREVQATAEMQRARVDAERRAWPAAILHYQAAQKLAPDTSGPYLGLGLAHAELGECEQAIEALERYLEIKRTDPKPGAVSTLAACRALLEVKRRQALAILDVTSEPPGASVRLDDENGPVAGVTPFEDSGVKPGAHVLFVDKPGYLPTLRRVEARGGVAAVVAVPLMATPPLFEVKRGRLVLRGLPSASHVTLAGPEGATRFDAKRALDVTALPGLYRVEASADGYHPAAISVELRSGATVDATLPMRISRTPRGVWIALGALGAAGLAVGLGVGLAMQKQPETAFGFTSVVK